MTATVEAPTPMTAPPGDRRGSWVPTWALISTKNLELRTRRGLMVVVGLLTIGLPFIVLGIRLLFHAVDPKTYGPAGTPDVFEGLCNAMAEFGFIAGAALGATAGTTDFQEGIFRHLVITGRSRLALYLARIPAGLAIVLPLMAVAFTSVCLVTSFAGTPQPTSMTVNGVTIPLNLSQSQFAHWVAGHPAEAVQALSGADARVRVQPAPGSSGSGAVIGKAESTGSGSSTAASLYPLYLQYEYTSLNPPMNEMVKIGLWIELEVLVGFMIGLGLGSLLGQRTAATILVIVLEIIVTPILVTITIPHFVNAQRLLVGVALDQLRPAALASPTTTGHRFRGALFGGRAALGIPPMPTWAMVTVIVGWIVGWSVLGAWRMATRDA